MIPDSRLYTFIDHAREYALYFLEGQKLIQDLALVHSIRRVGFAYFRDVVLSVQPMVALLKGGEQFGFYIDSEDPYFRLKIETAHHGTTRCMLLPEDLPEFPETMRGLVRVQKVYPANPPYESVLRIEGLPLREIVNRVLDESYQVNCVMMLSDASDQSLMLHQLPPPPRQEDYEFSLEAVRTRREDMRDRLRGIFAKGLTGTEEIVHAFSGVGFRLLADRPMRFFCGCSKERMIDNLRPIYSQHGAKLFEADGTLEVVCEYCKSRYRVARVEVERASGAEH